jgi:hypothetical protein
MTDFDLAAVVGSAVVSAVVSLGITSWKVGQEERAKRRFAAKDSVSEAVGEVLEQVTAYKFEMGSRRSEETSHWISDSLWARKVLAASKRLGWVRRRLIEVRLRRLVGPVAFELAVAKPTADPGTATVEAIFFQVKQSRAGKYPEGQPLGMLDVALTLAPDSREVAKLHRQLKRLGKAR